jgi:hypothetical protein
LIDSGKKAIRSRFEKHHQSKNENFLDCWFSKPVQLILAEAAQKFWDQLCLSCQPQERYQTGKPKRGNPGGVCGLGVGEPELAAAELAVLGVLRPDNVRRPLRSGSKPA